MDFLGNLIANFHFIRPSWLLMLIPVFFFYICMIIFKRNNSSWEKVISPELAPILIKGLDNSNRKVGHRFKLLTLLGWIITILAIAGPTWNKTSQPIFKSESAVVIVFDLSPSMMAEDIKPNRLTRARFKLIDVLREIKEGSVSLIVYGDDAYVVSPLTEDSNTIMSIVPTLNPNLLPERGSNVEDGFEKAYELIKNGGFKSGDLLLITDGIDSQAVKSIEKTLRGDIDIRVSILGVGTYDGAPIPEGTQGFMKQNGNVVIAKLEDGNLEKITSNFNGIYKQLSPNDSDIRAFTKLLKTNFDNEQSESKREFDIWDDQGYWLIFFLLPLFISQFRKGVIICIVAGPLVFNSQTTNAFEWIDLWTTKDQQAKNAMSNEDYEKAKQLFKNENWKASAAYKAGSFDQALDLFTNDSTSTGFYNQGNSFARMGEFDKAIESYDSALKIDPTMDDALFNKQLIEDLKNRQNQNQNQNQEGNQTGSESDQENTSQNDTKDSTSSQENESNNQDESNSAEQTTNNQIGSERNKENNNQSENKTNQFSQDDQNLEDEPFEKTENVQSNEQTEDNQSQQKQFTEESNSSEREDQEIEQMLRKIPDDPGGLLRNKFRYQKIQRYRDKSQPDTTSRI